MRILGRHRVRATFYHMVALVFLLSTWAWLLGLLSDKTTFLISLVLFVTDYLAEMYDPHPDKPGAWYKHFHRVLDNSDD